MKLRAATITTNRKSIENFASTISQFRFDNPTFLVFVLAACVVKLKFLEYRFFLNRIFLLMYVRYGLSYCGFLLRIHDFNVRKYHRHCNAFIGINLFLF